MKISQAAQIEQLRVELARHDNLYFRRAAPEISDAEFDCLAAALAALEKSAAPAIGDDRSAGFAKVAHLAPTLSLDKVHSEPEFLFRIGGIFRELRARKIEMLVEPKIDGISVSCTYENGKFVRAVTRGNGREGDDISRHAPNIAGVPAALRQIPGKTFPRLIEIRGEIYMKNTEFRRINAQREHDGLEPFATPRNLAAGTVKSQNPAETRTRRLDTFFYGIGACEPDNAFSSLSELRETLRAWGLQITAFCEKVDSAAAAAEQIRTLGELRKRLDYPTDGAVVKINSFALQRRLGEKPNAPRWAVAFKFPPPHIETTILGIEFRRGKTGRITPVAAIAPVSFGNTKIRRVSLGSKHEMKRKNLHVGDRVTVILAGDILPQILRKIPAAAAQFEHNPSVKSR